MSEEFKNAILAGLYDSKYAPKLEGPAPKLLTNQPTETLWSHLQQELLKIGRASCRERVSSAV